jgi:hypothetical protein
MSGAKLILSFTRYEYLTYAAANDNGQDYYWDTSMICALFDVIANVRN